MNAVRSVLHHRAKIGQPSSPEMLKSYQTMSFHFGDALNVVAQARHKRILQIPPKEIVGKLKIRGILGSGNAFPAKRKRKKRNSDKVILTRQVSSMIHQARVTFSPVVNIAFP